MPRSIRFVPATLALALAAPALTALPLPTYRAPVMDDALLLQAPHRIELTARIEALRREHDVELAVLTLPRLADFGHAKASGEDFATRLFDHWALGTRRNNRGALVLVCKEDRFVRIELGAGWGRSMDGSMKWAIDHVFVPRFKKGEYSLGVLGGTKAVIEALTGHPREVEAVSSSAPARSRAEDAEASQAFRALVIFGASTVVLAMAEVVFLGSGGMGWAFLTLLGTMLFALFSVLSVFFPRRRRWGGSGGGFSGGGGASGSW